MNILPRTVKRIKNIVAKFVGKLGLPFTNTKKLEEELSKSISEVLLDASSDNISQLSSHEDSNSDGELSSITVSLRNQSQASFMSIDGMK